MSNTELIAEARAFLDSDSAQYYDASLVRGLVTALEEADARIKELETDAEEKFLPGYRERTVVYWWISKYASFGPVESVRYGWYQALCDCGWSTDGLETIVDDALYEHARECMKPSVA